jgi:diguanylate cyclase (GGDEF)-like protein/PAS domain S-box-containing protein
MAGQVRTALVVVGLVVVGAPVLIWLRNEGVVLGDPWVLALLLPLTVLVTGDHSERRADGRRPNGHPFLRLLLAAGLIAAFCWTAGWSLVVPAGIVLAAVPLIHRSSSRLWIATAANVGVLTAAGQAGVELGYIPTVVQAQQSHLAAGWLLLFAWSAAVVIGRDAAEGERSQNALARAEARLRALMESSTDVLTVSDAGGTLFYVSPATERGMGYRPDELIGRPLLDLVDVEQQAAVRRRLDDLVARGHDARSGMDVLTVHASLERRWYEWTFHNLLSDSLVQGVVVQQRDVSERLQAQRALAHAASHDDLTGLSNRGELLRRMSVSVPQAGPGAAVAVLFVDLDLFKDVNDRLGHRAGDDVLVVVARRLAAALRSHDHLGRLGGDEFGVLLTELRDEDEVHAVVARLISAIEQPITLPEGTVNVGVSIGHAYTTDPSTPLDRLLATADSAMYATKNARRH